MIESDHFEEAKKILAQTDAKWDPVIDAVLVDPHSERLCPICGMSGIKFGWKVTWRDPRKAAVFAECDSCGNQHRSTVFLPKCSMDSYSSTNNDLLD